MIKLFLFLFLIPQLALATTGSAISIDKLGWRIDANIGGANPALGTSTITSQTEIVDAGLDMVLQSGSASAKIPCSSTNASTGLTCSSGSEGLGVVFQPPTAGAYEVCAIFTHESNVGSSGSVNSYFQLNETAASSQTIIQSGNARQASGEDAGSGSGGHGSFDPHNLCSTFTFSDTSERTVRLMYTQVTGNTVFTNRIHGDRDANKSARDVKFSVRRRVEFADAVKFTNLVTTPRSAGVKIESVMFGGASDPSECTSSPCTVYRSSSGITSVTRSSTGVYVVNFATAFSAAPDCVTSYLRGSAANSFGRITSVGTTSTEVRFSDGNNNAIDSGASLVCVGAK